MRSRIRRRIAVLDKRRAGMPGVLVAIGMRLPAPLRARAAAGLSSPNPAIPAGVAGRQVLIGAGSAVTAGMLAGFSGRGLLTAALAGVAGWRLPLVKIQRRSAARRSAVLASLPDTLELLAACAKAGSSIRQSFELAAEHDPGPLGEAMRQAVRAIEHGAPARAVYLDLAERTGVPELNTVAATLRRCESLGTSVAGTLAALAADMRDRRRSRADEEARRLPVRVLFPVVLCFLPAFVLLTIAPVLVVALRGFRGA